MSSPESPNSKSLDSRYGKPREHLNARTAKEMERVDSLIEKAGVKQGDEIEVLCNDLKTGQGPAKWQALRGTFHQVDNGRFFTQLEPDDKLPLAQPNLREIIDVRKKSQG